MSISGTDFEDLVEPFFNKLFKKMGFIVIQVRNQKSGSQDGFDIQISFIDDQDEVRELFIECKYYKKSKLDWSEIFGKQVQLESSNHSPCAFILLSPLRNLSNIDHNIQANFSKKFKYPVDFWTPDKELEDLFKLDPIIYEKVYDKKCDVQICEEEVVRKFKTMVNILIQQSVALKFSNIIRIEETDEIPDEDEGLKTTLDEKLNSILKPDDEVRLLYHRIRAGYKVFLESLMDVNTELRTQIINWEDNLRLKAYRLTSNFNIDKDYTPDRFFHDFFKTAENDLLTFYDENELAGDREKLLHGIIFELAAKCPLDWRKDG